MGYRAHPKYLLSVRGGKLMDGSDLILWSGSHNPYQFILEDQKVKLKVDPSLCVSVREGKVGDGSDIILWTCGKTDEFLWSVSGDHILLDADQTYCLTVRRGEPQDGADIIL